MGPGKSSYRKVRDDSGTWKITFKKLPSAHTNISVFIYHVFKKYQIIIFPKPLLDLVKKVGIYNYSLLLLVLKLRMAWNSAGCYYPTYLGVSSLAGGSWVS